ncbi:MAG: hypothetical protein QOG62_1683 [Thermoleophilaceae bacterium]|nr:hypothetical protein [Thermoleophilaceae bacterium]
MFRILTGGCLLFAAAVLAACGGSPAQPAASRELAAAKVVVLLDRATKAGDWKLICSDLYSKEVRQQAGGSDCPNLLSRVAGGVRSPSIDIEAMTIGAGTATVKVTTRAEGQEPVPETIRLERDDTGRFRIAGLE